MFCLSEFPSCCTDASILSELGKRLVIRQKICYHTRVKSEGESGVSRHSPDPRNQRGHAWSATQSPGLRPTAMSIRGIPGEVSLKQMVGYFASLPFSGILLVVSADRID